MSLAIIHCRAAYGIEAPAVDVEVHLSSGLPAFNIVGLPETAVKESKDRVRSALINSHFDFPDQRITVNLAPADLPKDGGRFDLAIALGILAASDQLPSSDLKHYEFLAELALSGELRPVDGSLPAALACKTQRRALITASDNAGEAALSGTRVFAADNLLTVCAHLNRRVRLQEAEPLAEQEIIQPLDLADIRGQHQARRALEISASGNHNLLFCGPPGAGKTMLAARMPGILPNLKNIQALEVAAIYSSSQQLGGKNQPSFGQRPFRSPHHSASPAALVGGGSNPKPGEITLAHQGVLFLDELPEFPRHVLEVLREPLETGDIRLSRAKAQVCYPAKFQLLAAMNPCPCGYFGDSRCRCSPDQVRRYRNKISGPLLDRIDLQVHVPALKVEDMQRQKAGESSAEVRQRVAHCRERQLNRQGKANSELSSTELEQFCSLTQSQKTLLSKACDTLQLSARGYHRCLRVARTLADMAETTELSDSHLREALSFRQLT